MRGVNKIMQRLVVAGLLILSSAPAICEMYKYVDENGMTYFSNKPPAGKGFSVVESFDNIVKANVDWPPWEGVRPSMPGELTRKELTPSDVFRMGSVSVYTVISAASQDDIKTGGGKIAIGSAVAVSSRQLITNCHLFHDRLYILVKRGKEHDRARLVYTDREGDRCYIEVDKFQLEPVRGVRYFTALTVGERVYSIGAPRGLENTLSEGLISGLREKAGIRMIQTTAPISPGSSGGGLFDSRGNLIGITTLTLKGSQNMNFAISAEEYW